MPTLSTGESGRRFSSPTERLAAVPTITRLFHCLVYTRFRPRKISSTTGWTVLWFWWALVELPIKTLNKGIKLSRKIVPNLFYRFQLREIVRNTNYFCVTYT